MRRKWPLWIGAGCLGMLVLGIAFMAFLFSSGRNAPWAVIKTYERLNPGTKIPAREAGAADLPSWVPRYPGAQAGTAGFIGATGGVFELTTGDPAGKVFEFYRERLAASGFGVESTPNGDGSPGGFIQARSADGRRSINVAVGWEDGRTLAMLQMYEEAN